MRLAVSWLLRRKTSHWFRGNVRHAVETLGYEDIRHSIPR